MKVSAATHPAKVRVMCRASRGISGSGEELRCNTNLGYIDGPVRFVGIARRAPDQADGYSWVRCHRPDCHAWNIFERLEPL